MLALPFLVCVQRTLSSELSLSLLQDIQVNGRVTCLM